MRGVLVDVDGTLVLSNEAHARSWSEALAEHGYRVSPTEIVGLVGMGGDRVLPVLVPGLDDEHEPGRTISRRRREIFLERHAPDLEAAPGARALLQRFRDDGLLVVVGSSATQEELTTLLDIAQVADLVEETTSTDDAESSKPAPDIVQAALTRAGLDAADALMLGDTGYDIESAGRAGVRLVAVRCGGWSDDALDGALAVYDDPADVLAHYDASPFARLLRGRTAG